MASSRISLILCIMILVRIPRGIMPQKIDIGVCYVMLGNNLPTAEAVINLYKRHNIGKMRLFDPNPYALQALRGSGIHVTLGVRNQDTPNIASSIEGAKSWFEANVQPYLSGVNFSYISVGNEAIPGEYGKYIPAAMQNLQTVLDNDNLDGIAVTTSVSALVLGVSYPPSATVFTQEAHGVIVDVLRFLSTKGSPLMINVYPYFAYASDPAHIRQDYALFTAKEPVVRDRNLSYYNLFHAIIDEFFWAMEKEGASNVGLAVSESGWPSAANGDFTTKELASTYNNNFLKHIVSKVGTPKRPGAYIEGFIFALFNENQKPRGVEQNFGLFYPDMKPVYPVFN